MTMPTSDNPDFIALDMDPSVPATETPDASDDFIALNLGDVPTALVPMAETPAMPESFSDAPSLEAALASIVSPVTGNAAGSLTDGTMRGVGFSSAEGYVTALANGVPAHTAESYKRTLASQYGFTTEQIAALTVNVIAQNNLPVGTGTIVAPPEGTLNVFQQRRVDAGLAPNARMRAPVHATITTPTPTVPEIDRGILPREQILRDLAEQSPGTLITVARAQRRATHVPRSVIANALAGTEFADMAPRVKSDKRQFGEVMRGLNSQEFRTWAITRRDVQKTGQEWPESLVARWCMGALDGSDQLGTLGEKVLIADLLDNGEIRFTGGSDVLRQKVIDAFAQRMGEAILTATDLLTWFRDRVLPEFFHAFDCAGAIYVPGNPERLERFLALVSPHMSRRITLWDMVSGKKLSDSLMQGLIQMLDEIEADYGTDCEKAVEREQNKVRKQNPDHTDEDLALAARRAVVLPERAGTYLRRLNDAQCYLDGLKKLLGDDTASIRARLTGIRGVIEPLCDATSAMGAAIELD